MSLLLNWQRRSRTSALLAGLLAASALVFAACGGGGGGASSSDAGTSKAATGVKCDPNAAALKAREIPASLDPEGSVPPIDQMTVRSSDLGTDQSYKPAWWNTLSLTPAEVKQICDKNLKAVYLDWDKVLYNQAIRSGAKDVFAALNIKVVRETSFNFDPNGLQGDLQAVLPLKPDMILTGGTIDPTQMATLLEPARAKGIQIVSWGVGAKGWEIGLGKPMTSMVAYDFYALGQQMAKAVCAKYPDGANLGYLHWINNFSSIRLRETGFLDGLAKCPKIKVIADGGKADPTKPNSGFKDPNASQPTTEAFLTRHPEVNVIFGPWEDPPALGQIAAIRSRKKIGKVEIVTMDLGPTGASELKKSADATISVDMAQDIYDGGRAMALTAAMAAIKKEPPPFVIIPTFATTSDNLEDAWSMMHGPSYPCCGD
jgi:ribose transport system substrate-binding protein